MDWELYAWLKRGSRRREILELIMSSSTPLTANEVKNKLKIALSQVSFTIKELMEHKLIYCLNQNDKIGRLYKGTNQGKEILNEI